ncbi:helix-turn-helix domain-containing protein [Corynebacterium sp. H128]|uniref:helix-turn-helix domain-containing protein n=1 Tax=unclassified Corynebacterium TaxID=2624378 RepID=UPI0030B70895
MAANFSTKELKTSVDQRNFRNEIKKAIATVTAFWPDAGITADLQGVTIQRGQPSVTITSMDRLARSLTGRAPALTTTQVTQAREWVNDGIPKAEIARRLGIGRTTLYKYLAT